MPLAPETADADTATAPMSPAPMTPPGQPPAGPSPTATMATANRGAQATAILQLQGATKIINMALMAVGVGSDMGKDLLDVLKKLSKYVPATPPSAGLENNALRQLMLQQRQQGPGADVARALALKPAAPVPPPAAAA